MKLILGLGVLIFVVTIGLAIDIRSSINTDRTTGRGFEVSFGLAIGSAKSVPSRLPVEEMPPR